MPEEVNIRAYYLRLDNLDFYDDFDEIVEFCSVTDNFVSYKEGFLYVLLDGEYAELNKEDVLLRVLGRLSIVEGLTSC